MDGWVGAARVAAAELLAVVSVWTGGAGDASSRAARLRATSGRCTAAGVPGAGAAGVPGAGAGAAAVPGAGARAAVPAAERAADCTAHAVSAAADGDASTAYAAGDAWTSAYGCDMPCRGWGGDASADPGAKWHSVPGRCSGRRWARANFPRAGPD
eukprot:COSAG02_NODE_1130_length_14395_cov_10.634373_6_plen_156_part_00